MWYLKISLREFFIFGKKINFLLHVLPGFLQVTDWFKQVSNETVSEETFTSSDVYGTFYVLFDLFVALFKNF